MELKMWKASVGLIAVWLLTGCNGVEMASQGEVMAKGAAAQEGREQTRNPDGQVRTPDSMPANPSRPNCESRLADYGLVEKAPHQWVKKVNVPCDYLGVGYRVLEVTIDSTVACTLYNPYLPSPETLTYLFSPDKGSSQTDVMAGLTIVEKERHCANTARCGSGLVGSTQALGRWAWIKKCENQVPAFGELLALIRTKEKNADSVQLPPGGDFSIFSRNFDHSLTVAKYYPVIPRTGETAAEGYVANTVKSFSNKPDSFPAPAVTYAGDLFSVDDLLKAEIQSQVTDPCPAAADVQPIDALCSAGCYRADQRVLVEASGRYEAIKNALENVTETIAVLDKSSTIQSPRLINAPVGRFVASLHEANETLLHIETQLGLKLIVTTNHPLLDARGVMREASDLKVGDQLLRVDGRADAIAKVHSEDFVGKVYNVAPISGAPEDNLLVAEGVISGSHNYQTEMHSYINRQVLRSHLSKGY